MGFITGVDLDIKPCSDGHTLIVPKREVKRFEELDDKEITSLMLFLKRIIFAINKCFNGIDYNIILNNGPKSGQEVMHVHFHIIPRLRNDEGLFSKRKNPSNEELQNMALKIKKFLK